MASMVFGCSSAYDFVGLHISNKHQLLDIMPTVKLGVLASIILLPASLALASEWGRGTYKPRPMVYVEAPSYVGGGSKRLVVYNGPTRDCEVAADPYTITNYRNVSMPVSASKITALIERCQRVHALLYRRNPAAYDNALERRDRVMEANAVANQGSSNSLWSLNLFNRLAIFPGTKVR